MYYNAFMFMFNSNFYIEIHICTVKILVIEEFLRRLFYKRNTSKVKSK